MKPDQLSKTASFIAVKFYGLTLEPTFRGLFEDSVITFYDRVVQSLPAPINYYHYWLTFDWVRRLYTWSEELLLPGDLLHIIARKYYIRQLVNGLKFDGYKQIVVLGAGFDDLAFTYLQKGFSCIEIDVPRMAKQKRQFFNHFYSNSKHPEVISSHLTAQHTLPFHPNSTIDPNKKTIIVAEGFFDYLQIDLVGDILNQMHHFFEETPALVTTHFALDELPLHHRWSFKTGVKTVGEKLKLHQSIKEFKELLIQHKFPIRKQYKHTSMANELRELTGTDLPMLRGFYLLQAH